MVWYSRLFKNFQQFVVIYTVKSFVITNKAEVDVFLELSCFFDDPMDVGYLMDSIMLVCAKHQHESAIGIHMSPPS